MDSAGNSAGAGGDSSAVGGGDGGGGGGVVGGAAPQPLTPLSDRSAIATAATAAAQQQQQPANNNVPSSTSSVASSTAGGGGGGGTVAGGGTSSAASSPVPNKPTRQQLQAGGGAAVAPPLPTTPDLSSSAAVISIAPQNPFDQIIVGSGSGSNHNPSSAAAAAPLTPDRVPTSTVGGGNTPNNPPASPGGGGGGGGAAAVDYNISQSPSLPSAPTTPILDNTNSTSAAASGGGAMPNSAPPHVRSSGGAGGAPPPANLNSYLEGNSSHHQQLQHRHQPPSQPQHPQSEQRYIGGGNSIGSNASTGGGSTGGGSNSNNPPPAAYSSAPPHQHHHHMHRPRSAGMSVPQQPVFDDDENTEPSSEAANTNPAGDYDYDDGGSGSGSGGGNARNSGGGGNPYARQSYPGVPDATLAGSFARFVEQTRIRFGNNDGDRGGGGGGGGGNSYGGAGGGYGGGASSSSNRRAALSDDDMQQQGGDSAAAALICGYLQKLGRNGKWQTRWFETDGECLSYYKSSKRKKLLATLDLEKVGAIDIDPDDVKGCSFTIQVLGRLYHLRAASRASCKDWVITLNRVKEARMNQGNVKLVSREEYLASQLQQRLDHDSGHHHGHQHQEPLIDLLDHRPSDDITPRVVLVANRQRTRAVDESQEWDQLIEMEDGGTAGLKVAQQHPVSPYEHHKRRSTIGNVVLARWSKQRPTLSRLGQKLVKWAKSLRKLSCHEIEDCVQLDHHVHPPGHDDYNKRAAARGRRKNRPPVGNLRTVDEGSLSGGSAPRPVPSPVDEEDDGDDDGGIVESAGVDNRQPRVIDKPTRAVRAFSATSDDDARMIA